MNWAGIAWAGIAGLWVALLVPSQVWAADAGADKLPRPLPSGTTFLSDALKARQKDDAANPAMLWVEDGAALWARTVGAAGKACANCHGRAPDSMKGVAARYPAIDKTSGQLVNLEGRINLCRTRHQQAEPLASESNALLGLEAFIALQSRGLPIRVDISGAAMPYYERGKAFFHRRQGQLNLSCAQCHTEKPGRRLRGDVISYAVPTGYPIYRLEWQSVGSLHRRFRSCSFGVRAVRFPLGSPEYLALELYLAKRAEGATIEAPAIRK